MERDYSKILCFLSTVTIFDWPIDGYYLFFFEASVKVLI